MSRTLLLLRHAKSAWDTDAPSDFERPLAKRGKKDAPRIGRFLRMEGLVPDLVFSSSARRARKTASKVARELELSKKEIVLEDRLYEASLGTLLRFLATVPADAETVLLVGHIPDLENLLRHLARELPKSPEEAPSDVRRRPPRDAGRLARARSRRGRARVDHATEGSSGGRVGPAPRAAQRGSRAVIVISSRSW